MAFEGGVFSAAAYLMGLINAESVAAHAVALQIAAISLHGALGIEPGRDRSRRTLPR